MSLSISMKKNKYINMLKRYNSWGEKNDNPEKAARDVINWFGPFDSADNMTMDNLVRVFNHDFKTTIFNSDQALVSPISLDSNLELPLTELFFDNNNFVVLTTKRIYSCRNGQMHKIEYDSIKKIDEDAINSIFIKRPNIDPFFDIVLICVDDTRVSIAVEYGQPFRSITYFLISVNDS